MADVFENISESKKNPSQKALKAIGTALRYGLDPSWSWLQGDGSNRRYARVQGGQKSAIAMVLDQDSQALLLDKNYDWLPIQKILSRANVPCPKVYSTLQSIGTILIEDCGDVDLNTCLSSLAQPETDQLLNQCFDVLRRVQSIKISSKQIWCQRQFDAAKLKYELLFFVEHFLENTLKIDFLPSYKQSMLGEIDQLSLQISELRQCFVHRDFHSRNIMIKNNKPLVIDFQDARLGPYAYDPVSLCFDSYLDLSNFDRVNLLNKCILHLSRSHSYEVTEEMRRSWPLVLLQRQLKALGSFGYLTLVKKKNYLRHAPEALKTLNIDQIYSLASFPILSKDLLNQIKKKMGL